MAVKNKIQVILPFDLETTGLIHQNPAVIEIACCPFDINLKDLEEFDSGVMQVYGDRKISEQALKANGISRKQIAEGEDTEKVVNELVKYLTSLKVGSAKPILAGHNIDSFDIPLLNDLFEFFKKDLSKYVNVDFTIDTLWWSRAMFAESENYKLGTCCKNVGLEVINAHRALNDTRANKDLLKKMISNMRGLGGSIEKKEKRFRETFEI